MAYTLYTDRAEEFVCEIAVKNASLKNAFARMIVETDDITLMFKGQLKDGKCIVPLQRMKGLLSEATKGKMQLEVIVEDTYFTPWKDNFIVEEHTSVKVNVTEQQKPSRKPIVEVKTISPTPLSPPAQELIFICERVGIKKKTFPRQLNEFKEVIREYFKASPEFVKHSRKYIQETITAMK